MFIRSLKYDYQTGGILVEYVTKAEACEMKGKLIKSIFEKGELEEFEGYVTGVYSVENYLMLHADVGADELDELINFIKTNSQEEPHDENDYKQKGANESSDPKLSEAVKVLNSVGMKVVRA